MYVYCYDTKAWPSPQTSHKKEAKSLFAFRKTYRSLREFARLEDNWVMNEMVFVREERDLAHEADMRALAKEQLRADIDPEEALQEALDSYDFNDYDF